MEKIKRVAAMLDNEFVVIGTPIEGEDTLENAAFLPAPRNGDEIIRLFDLIEDKRCQSDNDFVARINPEHVVFTITRKHG